MKPIANNFGDVQLPPTDPRYVDGGAGLPGAERRPAWTSDAARQRLKDAGFQVADQPTSVNSSAASYGDGGRHLTERSDHPGLDHHDPDQQRHCAGTAATAADGSGAPAGAGARIGQTVVEIPGLPPITVPVLAPPPPPPPPP